MPGDCFYREINQTGKKNVEQKREPVHNLPDWFHLLRKPAVFPFFKNSFPPFLSRLPVRSYIFFVQMFDFLKSAFEIGLFYMNLLHTYPLQNYTMPVCSLNRLIFLLPAPSSVYMFQASPVPRGPSLPALYLRTFHCSAFLPHGQFLL